jgi:hypothetical protein
VARDGEVFESCSYTASVITTAELERLLVNPSRNVVTRAELEPKHPFRSLGDLEAEVSAALSRLGLPKNDITI